MSQNNNHYALIEFLRSVIEYLDSIEGESLNVPKSKLPYFKKLVHDAIGEIVYRLYCIDRIINPELVDEGFEIDTESKKE